MNAWKYAEWHIATGDFKKEIKNIVKEKNINSMKNDVEMDTMEEVEAEVEGIVDDMIGE